MRRLSSQGSNTDKTDDGTDLRKRENAARQRDSDGDTILTDPLLMQRDLPARLVFNVREHSVAIVCSRGRANRGTAMMMTEMVAVPRGGHGHGIVNRMRMMIAVLRTRMAMMMELIKTCLVEGGPMLSRGARERRGPRILTAVLMATLGPRGFVTGDGGRR